MHDIIVLICRTNDPELFRKNLFYLRHPYNVRLILQSIRWISD